MADKQARDAAIKKASRQVVGGSGFVRRKGRTEQEAIEARELQAAKTWLAWKRDTARLETEAAYARTLLAALSRPADREQSGPQGVGVQSDDDADPGDRDPYYPTAVEALRESLWSTWGKNRKTTDWPTREQLAQALEAAGVVPEAERLTAALALIYAEGYKVTAPLAVAHICDEHLDRTGVLLGKVRDEARTIASSKLK